MILKNNVFQQILRFILICSTLKCLNQVNSATEIAITGRISITVLFDEFDKTCVCEILHFTEHEYRSNEGRRVSFKPNRQYRKDNTKDWTASVRAHLQDEDIDMGGSSTSTGITFSGRKFAKYKHRSGSPMPNKGGGRRKVLESPTGWYRITVSLPLLLYM